MPHSGNFDPRRNKAQRHQLAKMLGYRILEDINECTVITPIALVATILLASRGRGIAR
jgi:glycerol-3-phosphate O-acyltransferase